MWTIAVDNPEGRTMMGILITFLALGFIFTSLRIWARHLSGVRIDASDIFCILSLVLSIGLTVIIWGVYAHGWGQDISKFTAADADFSAIMFPATLMVWNSAAMAIRVSILLFYIRIFAISQWRKIFWINVILNVLSLVAVLIGAVTICRPIKASYLPTLGHCGNLLAFETFSAIWSLLADGAIVLLPMPILWKLQMDQRKKLGLSIIFGMGTLICLITIVRLVVSQHYELDNVTKQNAIVVFITGLEPLIGIIVACLPFMPAVLKNLGKSNVFLTLSQPFRTFVSRPNYVHSRSGTRGSAREAPKGGRRAHTLRWNSHGFGELEDHDTEMKLLHERYLGNSEFGPNITVAGGAKRGLRHGTNGTSATLPRPPQGHDIGAIHVRNDFIVSHEER